MYRIRPYRCGYGSAQQQQPGSRAAGYYCNGVKSLNAIFTGNMLYDPELERTGDDATSTLPKLTGNDQLINNYGNLPAAARGFVMSGVPVMSDSVARLMAQAYPEATCTTDDMTGTWKYAVIKGSDSTNNNYIMGHSKAADATTEPTTMLSWNSSVPAGSDSLWTTLKKFPLNFTDGASKFTPGVLEPMLDTDFSPVPVTGISSFEMGLDGLLAGFSFLGQWRASISASVPSSGTDLKVPKPPEDNGCGTSEWRIEVHKGELYGEGTDPEPEFKLYKGPLTVTGSDGESLVEKDIDKVDLGDYEEPFKVTGSGLSLYVGIKYSTSKSGNEAVCYMNEKSAIVQNEFSPYITAAGDGYMFTCIGSIRRSVTSPSTGKTTYTYWIEANDNCAINIDFKEINPAACGDNGAAILNTGGNVDAAKVSSVMSRLMTKCLFCKEEEE